MLFFCPSRSRIVKTLLYINLIMFKILRKNLFKLKELNKFSLNYTGLFYNCVNLTFCRKVNNGTNLYDDSSTSSDEENAQDRTVYDFIDSSLNLQAESVLNKIKCQGCGIHMQTESPNKIGYIPKQKLKEYLNPQEANSSQETKGNDIEIKEFEKIHDKATLKKLKKLKKNKNVIICERCFKLTNYLNFDDLSEKSLQAEKKEKSNAYTTLVKKINTQKLTHQIMSRISNKAHIFYICVR